MSTLTEIPMAATPEGVPRAEMRTGTVISHYKNEYHHVHYTDWGPPDAGRVVLCLHSLFQSCAEFDGFAAVLAGEGFRVLCPDFAGHGRSGWRREAEDYGYPLHAGDVMGVIARSGAARVDVVGSSAGGLCAMKMGRQGAPFRSLIINDIGPDLPKSAAQHVMDNTPTEAVYPSAAAIERALRKLLSASGPIPREAWVHFVRRNVARHGTGFRLLYDPRIRRQLALMTIKDHDIWDKWNRVACPALVIRGERSDMLSAEVAQQMARRPGTDLLTVPGCGHRPWLWTAEQAAPVVAWLKRVPA